MHLLAWISIHSVFLGYLLVNISRWTSEICTTIRIFAENSDSNNSGFSSLLVERSERIESGVEDYTLVPERIVEYYLLSHSFASLYENLLIYFIDMTREEFERKRNFFTQESIKVWHKASIDDNKKFMEIFWLEEWDFVDFRADNYLSTTRRESIITEWTIFQDSDWIFKIKSNKLLTVLYEKPYISRHKGFWTRQEIYIAPIKNLEFVDHNFIHS